jgi:hypothetical protein
VSLFRWLLRWLVQYLVFMLLSLASAVFTILLMGVGAYFIHFGGWLLITMGTVELVATFFVLLDVSRRVHSIMYRLWQWVEFTK